ncbi:PRPP-binding protein, adenine/guanine phosphoribosyltransferase [Deinococcus peraridilitoris DSM 19664]|uniref:PRPP-binding protein, adenine/guanine phosphoribosyltransferase n=1 Tax=Deinococcus peraridilitoris (strain DSM 19664 / LMG 22246 / CIP 109416 / KR-200) TaxID=937777 RepID=L0A753_DEIPD|nr:PRPP-binding protein, adenine/guanine phosphoribosyltransferase [Deinococcus peraridilitoris DSM 19664]
MAAHRSVSWGGALTIGRRALYTTPVKMHTVQVGDVHRDLPIVEVAPGVSVALFNMLGDTEVTEAAGRALAERLPEGIDTLVTPEVKALPLAHVISRYSGKPYIVIRKTQKPYMVEPVMREVVSITTGKPQLLVLDGFDVEKVRGKKVAIVDDVVSSGGTLQSLTAIIEEVGGTVAAVVAVFTEGAERPEVISLGHLPLFG